MWEFSLFVLTTNLLALTEKNGSLVCTPPMSVKEVKPVKFCPLSLFCVVRLFRFYYFRRFCHSERGIKSLTLEVTCIDLH